MRISSPPPIGWLAHLAKWALLPVWDWFNRPADELWSRATSHGDIKQRIVDVLRQHDITDEPTWANERVCRCGESLHTFLAPHHTTHIADALIRELGLRATTPI